MAKLFTAQAESIGGRSGHVKDDSGILEFDLGPAGKNDGKTNPEALFACGYSACFGSALDSVAKSEKVDLRNPSVKAEVSLHQEEKAYHLSVVLNVSAEGIDKEVLRKLVEKAHQVCPYSKATRGNIEVELQVEGAALKLAA